MANCGSDKLTRQLSVTQRRKRTDLEYVGAQLVSGTLTPGSTVVSTGGGGSTHCQTSCPNMGPIDGGIEFFSAQSTGTVIGHVYEDVNLSGVGMIAGADIVSFCYDARVGPSTSPIELYCDNKFGLFESGLLAAPDFSQGLSNWTVLRGTWETAQDVSGTWYLKGYPQPDIFDHVSSGEGSRQGDWSLIKYDALPDRKQVYLHFKFQRQGVSLSDYNLSAGVAGRWHSFTGDPAYQTTGSDLQVRWGTDTTAAGADAWAWWKGNSGGLIVMTEFTLIKPQELGIGTPVGGVSVSNVFTMLQPNPVHFYVNTDSGSTDGGFKYQSEYINWEPGISRDVCNQQNAIHADMEGHLSLAVYNWIDQVGILGYPSEEVGWWKVYDVLIMKDRKVSWDVGSSGRFVKLDPTRGGGTFVSYTPFGSSTSGVVDSYSLWRGTGRGFSTATADVPPNWGASYPMDNVEIHSSSVMSSTTLVDSCNEALVYGGDVWGYSSGGFSTALTAVSTGCAAHIKLNFLDGSGTILSTFGSTIAINTFAYSRVTGAGGIAIPSNAITARFTQVKTGAGDCFAVTDDLQFNVGDCCCPYSPPLVALIAGSVNTVDWSTLAYSPLPTSIGGQAITQVFSTRTATWMAGSQMEDAYDEHRTSPVNMLVAAHSAVNIPLSTVAASTGDINSTAVYPVIGFDAFGLSTANRFSFRFQTHTSTV